MFNDVGYDIAIIWSKFFCFSGKINNAYIQKIGDAAHHLKYDGHYIQISVVGHNTNGVFIQHIV